MKREFKINGRLICKKEPPFVIAEAGINHEGDINKAFQLIDAAKECGADCIKFQCHIKEAEMIKTGLRPGKISTDALWDIIKRCELTFEQELRLKKYCAEKGITFLSTPFSRDAADRLERIGVEAYKIGSGECNNLPLIEHIAAKKKPIILSTGMNDLKSIRQSVKIIRKYGTPFILMHCTSIYPTPFDKVRLGAIKLLEQTFKVPVGLSDHSEGIYTCFGAVALGACVLEKHFTLSRDWPGPDISISITPDELRDLVKGSKAIFQALGGEKLILEEEKPVIEFAYSCVVAIRNIKKGESFSLNNIWVKRPGTGQIKAASFHKILGRKAATDINKDEQVKWEQIYD